MHRDPFAAWRVTYGNCGEFYWLKGAGVPHPGVVGYVFFRLPR